MYYSTLQLRNYRSYEDYSVELSPSVNIVVGPNASGKTNLLEAILVASRGRSFRAKDADLIRFDQAWLGIDAYANDEHQRTVRIKTDGVTTSKEITIDEKPIKRMTRDKLAPTTLFEPEHLRMIHGSPEVRRNYLDGILEHITPGYGTNLRHYKRALAQRNRLLKRDGRVLADEIFIWDVKLSEYGARVAAARRQLVDTINRQAGEIYSSLSGVKSKLVLEYKSDISPDDYASKFLKLLSERFEIDRQRGFTGLGPHREDITFILNGRDAAGAASRGETRTIVLMSKLIELGLIEEERNDKPVLLLDDVFSELDSARRRSLTEYLKDYQVVITTTDADAIIKHFIGEYNVIPTTTR